MAHAGSGGSAGRGFGGSRWGRSGSGGHEKLPVHVEDALTYLDQVKIRFGSDPATYNGFLEIMKEFKSQSIDTPGVIRRVSQLFHEHPDLIVGFNAFLPLGYRIDIPKNGKLNIQSPLSSQDNSHSHGDCGEDFKQMSYKEDRGQVPLESDSVEFNNAISYVNKIKTRFLDHPEIYRSFLEILHTYQKEQLHTKGRPFRGMSEEEVFTEVANLFRGQEDLLSEFGQFLPEAKRSLFTGNGSCEMNSGQKNEEKSLEHNKKRSRPSLLRPVSAPAKKKMKLRGTKDLSIAAVGKYGTLQEFSFFDKVRRVLKSQEVYENFLRCIALFNQELVSGSELLQLVSPFLGKFPELFAQFKSFLGVKELSFAPPMSDRSGDGISREIDYASCKRIGSSYRALPKTYQQPKCSGRTAICKEVLNDTWVSFPSWSEDSTFVSSKKTPYEEQLHRCEDERFELDVVLETNLATIRVLESVQKKLSRMAPEDQEKLRLDDCLGGTSEVIQRRAIHRIYGDKAPEVIESLKRNPATAVPVVLKRLKAKEEEWREAQQGFNKIWREQYEKAYLKSLDHQAVNFKQNDTKALRSKSLLNEIESVYDEHQEQHSEGRSAPSSEPHLIFVYEDRQILEDAAALISYYVKRQPAIQKEDQGTIRQLLHRFLPSLFFSQQCPGTSDDSADERDRDRDSAEPERRRPTDEKPPADASPEPPKVLDDVYSLFFANNNWYFFLRLHQTLCARLLKIYRQAQKQLLEHRREQEREQLLCEGRREKAADPAMELRLKQPSEVELEEYYPAFLDMVRSLLEGSIDPTQYEDTLREMFTIHAYIGFTMDKLVQNIARQLHHLVSDDVCLKVVELYLNEQQRGAAGGNLSSRCVRAARETSYQWKAERCMADENCFKVMFLQRRGQVIMTIELLDTEEAQTEDPVEVQHLARYVEQYVGSEGASSSSTEGFLLKPVFLQRNLKKFRRWQCEQVRAMRGEAKSSWKRLMGVESACDVDCRFRLGTHKMVFIVNSEDYMYRRGTLCRAKQVQPLVLLRHHRHFEEWHGRWLEDNVTVAAAGLVQDWLMEGPLGPTVELKEPKSSDKPNPRGYPGKFCANDSDTLELPASSQALLLGWVPTRLVPALYGLVVAVGLPANGLALWVLATRVPRLPSTILLMNLAVADLLLALVLPPRLAYHLRGQRWPFGEAACRVATAALYGHMYGSVLLLAAVSLDRYLALVHPLRARALRGQRLTTGLCLVAWLSAATLALPLTLHRQTFRLAGSDRMLCHDALPLTEQTSHWRPAFICLAVLGCFVPLLAMGLCYGATLRALAANGQRYSHALRLTALVLFSAVASFTPSNVLLVLHYSNPSPEAWGNLYGAYVPSLALSTLNSCVDPFIYYYVSHEFREKVRAMLCRQPEASSSSQASREAGSRGTAICSSTLL